MSIKTKIKAIFTIIFSSALILSMSACKTTEEADLSSSEPTASAATTTTTTLPTTTTTTTTRKTTTTSKVTTLTTTTSAATTTTIPEQTTTQPTTTVANTVTTAATVVATTTTTTAAPIVTTTTAATTTTTTGATSTASIPTGNLTPTLKAYSDLAEYGVLTDEIRELITADVMNYAISKYGCVYDSSLYANSKTDYNGGFLGGAKNEYFKSATPEEIALYESWGIDMSAYKNATLEQYARGFQEEIFIEVDNTFEHLISKGYNVVGWNCGVGFCELYRDNGYVTYQVSFIY